MTRHPTTIFEGDRGVIIRKSGRIDAIFSEEGPIDETAQALLAAAFRIENDQSFREGLVDAFQLYHQPVEGFA